MRFEEDGEGVGVDVGGVGDGVLNFFGGGDVGVNFYG